MAKKTSANSRSRAGVPVAVANEQSVKRADKATTPVFIFKVALAYQKDIWRRIAIRGDQSLDDLHWAIYKAFDRFDEHLYSFYVAPPGTRGEARWRSAPEYACDVMYDNRDPYDRRTMHNAAETTIQSMGLVRQQVFRYLFDYGDEWRHDIAVEKLDAPIERGECPKILEKHGKSPPQYDYSDDDE